MLNRPGVQIIDILVVGIGYFIEYTHFHLEPKSPKCTEIKIKIRDPNNAILRELKLVLLFALRSYPTPLAVLF